MTSIRKQIAACAAIIKRNGIVAFPTETVYGLGADVFSRRAVTKIYKVKNRPFSDPLIVHISDYRQLGLIAKKIRADAKKLMKAFWPGPLTVVFHSKRMPKEVTAGKKTVSVRMPSDKTALEFIRKCGTPIAAPSANIFGKLSPTHHKHVEKQLGGKIDGIIRAGRCGIGIESTIVDMTGNEAVLLRNGYISSAEIEAVLGKKIRRSGGNSTAHPGMMKKHYSPATKLELARGMDCFKNINEKYAYVFLCRRGKDKILHKRKNMFFLSEKGDMKEAAFNLYSTLHKADSGAFTKILAERVQNRGIGAAIMERLRKASAEEA